DLRDALRGAGLPTSTYVGKDGLAPRADLAGLNYSRRPVALVECANMRNAQEAVMVTNGAGRARYAQAIAIGVLKWLNENPPTAQAVTGDSAKPSASARPSSSARAKPSASARPSPEN